MTGTNGKETLHNRSWHCSGLALVIITLHLPLTHTIGIIQPFKGRILRCFFILFPCSQPASSFFITRAARRAVSRVQRLLLSPIMHWEQARRSKATIIFLCRCCLHCRSSSVRRGLSWSCRYTASCVSPPFLLLRREEAYWWRKDE